MIYALIAALVATTGVSGVLATVLVMNTRLLKRAHEDVQVHMENFKVEVKIAADLQRQLAQWKHSNEDLSKTLAAKESECVREVAARKKAEEQRDRFLSELAKGGNPKIVAEAVNQELAALANLGKKNT